MKSIFYGVLVVQLSLTLTFWFTDRLPDATVSGIILIAELQLANILEKRAG